MRLDGNAAAGALQQVLAFDVTRAVATCAACGSAGELGGSFAYLNAPGVVLRCPSCEAVLLRAAWSERRVWMELSGCASLQLT